MGETGEMCIRGPCVFKGYFNEPEKTAEVVDKDGWYHTGDLATMDESGYAKIVGRSKDMIIRGGENIYPAEVEAFLLKHPAIADAQGERKSQIIHKNKLSSSSGRGTE